MSIDQRRLGSIIGPISLRGDAGTHDLRDSKWRGSTGDSIDTLSIVEHDAKFILVIEKKTIFDQLQNVRFAESNQCVVLTGGGYPGSSFHHVIHRIHQQLRVPLYVLADNDPGGYELFFLIARGSARIHSKMRAELAIPDAAFIGLRVRDFDLFNLNRFAAIDLTEFDRAQILRLKSSSWLQAHDTWQAELDGLIERGFKVEMEAFVSKSPSFLATSYLPDRLEAGDHLLLPLHD